jgi:PhnB protein
MLDAMNEILGLHPRLVVENADAALEFYVKAFGAEVLERYTVDGQVVHSMVAVGPVRFAVKDAGGPDLAPAGESVPVLMSLDVTDADAAAARMQEAGATVIFEVADHGYGDRGGRLRDPFGHQWMLSQQLEDLSAEQTQARLDSLY